MQREDVRLSNERKGFNFDVTATIWACLHHFPLPFKSYAGEVDGSCACLFLQWVLLQNRKTWVWEIYHFYNERQVNLFLRKRGLYPPGFCCKWNLEKLSGYRDVRAFHSWHTQQEYTRMLWAHGGLTFLIAILQILANSLRILINCLPRRK